MIHEQWQQHLTAAPAVDGAADAGIAYLPELAVVRFEGSNARSFLQGYLTIDTVELRPQVLLPVALCNLKGRVVMNGWCAGGNDEDVLVVLHESLVDTLAGFLQRYLMFSRNTSLVDLRHQVLVLGGLDLSGEPGGLVIDPRRRLFLADALADAASLWSQHPHLSSQAWLAALTADDVPLLSAPVSETFLPQMLGLDALGAIDFEKGCYLGQEVVARAQHRGQVKRHLTRLSWRGTAPPGAGAEITDDAGKAQGVVVQSTSGDASGLLLAVLREDAPDDLRQGDMHLRRVS